MATKKTILERCTATLLLGTLGKTTISQLLQTLAMPVSEYEQNTPIHLEGDPCNHLEVILEGSVDVQRINDDGTLMTIGSFSQDEILGGNIIFSSNPTHQLAVTAKSRVMLASIHTQLAFELMCDHPEFLRTFLEYISDHAALLGHTIRHRFDRPLRLRILEYLELESRRQYSRTIELPLSKLELAERLGVQRTSLSRELGKMRASGLIQFQGRQITLS